MGSIIIILQSSVFQHFHNMIITLVISKYFLYVCTHKFSCCVSLCCFTKNSTIGSNIHCIYYSSAFSHVVVSPELPFQFTSSHIRPPNIVVNIHNTNPNPLLSFQCNARVARLVLSTFEVFEVSTRKNMFSTANKG